VVGDVDPPRNPRIAPIGNVPEILSRAAMRPAAEADRMAGDAAAAVQHDNRGVGRAPGALTAGECRQTGIGPREIASKTRRLLSRQVGELDKRAG
jgi:hypothetical protein